MNEKELKELNENLKALMQTMLALITLMNNANELKQISYGPGSKWGYPLL